MAEFRVVTRPLPDGRTEARVYGFDAAGGVEIVRRAHFVVAKARAEALAAAEALGLAAAAPAQP